MIHDDDHDSWWWSWFMMTIMPSMMTKMTKLTVYYKAGTPSSQHYSPTKLRRRGETKPKGDAYLKKKNIQRKSLADMQFELTCSLRKRPKWDQKLSVACIYVVPLMYFKIRWLLASGCSTGTTSIYFGFSWCQLWGLKSKILDCW